MMAHKSNATMLWPRRRNQPVPESSAVDKAFRALLLCAVKGGVSCHQTSYLRFSRFNRSLFFRLRFFITYLTLPYGNLSARENLLVRTTALGLPESRIGQVLETVELTDTGKKKAGKFSLGMKQRLGIAAALLSEPELLILDEPTNGLDPFGIQKLRSMLREFASGGMTVLVSSHILGEVEQMADHIGILSGGVLGYQGGMPQKGHLEELFTKVVEKNRKGEWQA